MKTKWEFEQLELALKRLFSLWYYGTISRTDYEDRQQQIFRLSCWTKEEYNIEADRRIPF